MSSIFPVHVFHHASFDRGARGEVLSTPAGLAEIQQYVRWTRNPDSRLLVLHSISTDARATAQTLVERLSPGDFFSSSVDVLTGAMEAAAAAATHTVIVFTEGEHVFPLVERVSRLLGGEGLPAFSFSPDGAKNPRQPVAGEGLSVLERHIATHWRIQGKFAA